MYDDDDDDDYHIMRKRKLRHVAMARKVTLQSII